VVRQSPAPFDAQRQLARTMVACTVGSAGIEVAEIPVMSAVVATSALLRDASASLPPVTTEVATTLRASAVHAYEVFADVGATPRWLPTVQAATVIGRDRDGRPTQVSFRAALDRATLGYIVYYVYRPTELAVSWHTSEGGAIRVEGEARFSTLSSQACLMTYRLTLELPVSAASLERSFDNHAASAVVGAFREHLRRSR
jgi:ribosome-associated toxin RatA of RatAB toxin-antitoxin module